MDNKEEFNNIDINDVLSVYSEVKEIIDSGNINFDYQEFVKGFSKGYGYGTYSPMQQNDLMKSINFNPIAPTIDKLEKALMNAKENEDLLISYGQNFYNSNMVYRRTVDYLANLNNWDLDIKCINAKPSDYKTPAYKKDYKLVGDFLDKFDYRAEFSKALNNMIQNETYFCIFRDDMSPTKYVLETFPYRYAKLSTRSVYGLVYDIDYSYFMQPQVDINLFPKIIKKKYNQVINDKNTLKYIPSNPLGSRNGVFALWKQTGQDEGFWAFKLKDDSAAQIPYLSPMFADLILIPLFRKLQMNQSMFSAKKILATRYPLLKESKTNVTDMLAVKPETMGILVGAASKGIQDSINLVNIPSDGFEKIEFSNTSPDDYKNFISNLSSLMGGGNVLFQTNKNIIFEAQLALDIDCNLVNSVYSQFESFLEYYCNKLTKNFKFKFKLSGSNTSFDKGNKFKRAFDSAAVGVISANKIANALDMNIFELERDLDMTAGMEFTKKLMPMLNMYNQSNQNTTQNKGGRPQSDQNELTDSGSTTRENGSNQDRGGNV